MEAERRQRVFIVDDEEDLRLSARLNFELEGFEVDHARDGEEALAILRKGSLPDVILLDVQMPRMDGWDCLAAIKSDPKLAHIPVVLFTGKDAPADLESRPVQPDRYIVRPIGPISLLNAVRELLG